MTQYDRFMFYLAVLLLLMSGVAVGFQLDRIIKLLEAMK